MDNVMVKLLDLIFQSAFSSLNLVCFEPLMYTDGH